MKPSAVSLSSLQGFLDELSSTFCEGLVFFAFSFSGTGFTLPEVPFEDGLSLASFLFVLRVAPLERLGEVGTVFSGAFVAGGSL